MIRLDRPILIVTEQDAPLLSYAVAQAQRARRADGLPPSGALDRLAAVLAAVGHSASAAQAEQHDEAMTTTLTATQAAQALGVSERTARRRAAALGGRKTGGQWLIDAADLAEHIEGAKNT